MATDKPRFTITIDDDTLDRVSAYKKKNNISTQSKAISSLIKSALVELENDGVLSKPSPSVSDEGMKLAKDYDSLDKWGQKQLRSTADIELARCREARQALLDTEEPAPVEYIRHYLTAAAAGYAAPIEGEDYELIPRDKSIPAKADFCIDIDGDSMEPYIQNGQRVFVQRDTELQEFEVGIFFVDGDVYCKQWCVDFSGALYLLSANPKREDANIRIPRDSVRNVVCFGKVLLPRKLPQPEYL